MKSTRFFLKRAALLFGASLALLSASVILASCMTEDIERLEYVDPLIGTWQGANPGESYTITSTTFASENSYEGDNLLVGKLNTGSGYIYIKYTKALKIDETIDGTNYIYSEDAPDIGKWYAVMYEKLNADAICISGAYKTDGISAAETLEEAISEFTRENGYFDFFSECVRQ